VRPTRLAGAAGILAAVVSFHLLLAPRIADVDAFYHVGHAAHYLAVGPFDTAFPWTAFSIVGVENADMWWGFHLALLPFALFEDVAMGIGAAGLALTTVLLGGVWWIARRHGLVADGLWPILFLVAVPNVLYRYVMVRPETVSLLFSLLLLCFLARGRWWTVALASAGVTFFHLSMFWLPPGVLAAYFVARGVDRLSAGPSEPEPGRPWWMLWFAVLAGTAAGWLLRPHPLAAAKLAWVQIALLLGVKAQGGQAPLTFAVSLTPLDTLTFLRMAGPMVVAWAGSLALAASALRRGSRLRAVPPSERRLLWAAHLVAAGFLVMTLVVARRSLVQWEAFAVLGLAVTLTHLTWGVERRRLVGALALAVAALLPWAVFRHRINVRFVAAEPDHLAEVAFWLRDNSDPGDLVFNTHWDQFAPLFARDRVDRYVGGMDPIFQYAYDPTLYWRFHYLSTDAMTDRTCGTYPCTPEATVDTWSTLVRDFGARFVLVEPRRNPRLSRYLLQDDRYELGLETQHEAVFRVLTQPPER
jgi:hypothetical protein